MATAAGIRNDHDQLTDPASVSNSGRIYELDAIRALAALNLLLFHFTWVYAAKYGFESPLFGFMFPFGKYGVQMFFMLSGFVNAFTLTRKQPSATDFAVGRAIRIMPSFWLVILLNVVLLSWVPMFGQTVSLSSTVANASGMAVLFGFQCMEPVTWTLMVELLFYGFLMFALATGRMAKPMLGIILPAILLCYVGASCNQYIQANFGDSVMASVSAIVDELFLFRWMPLFAIGILLNEIKIQRGNVYGNGLGILLAAVVFHAIDVKNHNPAATAILFALLVASAYGKLPVLRIRPLLFVGSISYSLYLFHNNLGTLIMSQLEASGVTPVSAFVATTAAVIWLSALVTVYFERPATKLLSGWWVNRRQRFEQPIKRPGQLTAT